jgi:hypothetical protein
MISMMIQYLFLRLPYISPQIFGEFVVLGRERAAQGAAFPAAGGRGLVFEIPVPRTGVRPATGWITPTIPGSRGQNQGLEDEPPATRPLKASPLQRFG